MEEKIKAIPSLPMSSEKGSAGQAENKKLTSVITLNFNSRKIISVILECTRSLLNLKWRPLEIIIVDNGSTDGSIELIEEFVRANPKEEVNVYFVKLDKNLGFARGNNEGLKRVSEESKFIALINNDLFAYPDSLGQLVEFLDSADPTLAGLQPKVLLWNEKLIDSAGGILCPWGADAIGSNFPSRTCSEPYYVSHLYGAYSLYKNEAIRSAGGLFLPDFFMYGDDYELGIRLWNKGYKLAYIPIVGGKHFKTATGRAHEFTSYWAVRSQIAVSIMYAGFLSLGTFPSVLGMTVYTLVHGTKTLMRAEIDGIRQGLQLCRKRKSLEGSDSLPGLSPEMPRFSFSLVDYVLAYTRFRYLVRRRMLQILPSRYRLKNSAIS